MPGFIRRFQYVPGTDVITQIEGAVIVDLPPPGSITGSGVGTVGVVGEFADMTYGVAVGSSGDVTTKPQPVEVFSSQDMLSKVGGFDETLGDTGISGGNGFIAVRNKKFSRLVIAPVNLCSSKGVRMWRELPTCKSTTDPTAAVILSGAVVAAGREFKSGANRVRSGAKALFTAIGAYKQAADGSVTAAGSSGPTQSFTSATGAFLTCKSGGPVQKGDLLVVGVIGGATFFGANAVTYRVTADAVSATALPVELLSGANFDWSSGAALPYRVHPASDGDTGLQNKAADVGGYLIPARPLDATIPADTVLTPSLVPPAPTATSWDPLSGLYMRTIPTTGLVYTSTIQAPNAVSDATIDALYSAAIDSLLTDDLPAREVNIVVAARQSSAIRTKCKSHVLNASTQGVGRTTVISPALTTLTTSAAIADSDPGVGGNRDERVDYTFPGAQTFVPEAVGFSLKGADGALYTNGLLDTAAHMWLASVLSILPPERNPGQAGTPGSEVLSNVIAIQRGVSGLQQADYIQYRAKGIVALRNDRTAGFIFQSGVTTSLTSGQKNINRRRMADYIEDSLAQRYVQFSKQPLTNALKDTIVGETDAFLGGLLSVNNPPAQRINGYIIDDKSGNTPNTEAQGIFVVIAKVRTTPTADFIVLQCEIGEAVKVTAT
jgi:hypothetical protein